MWAQDFDGGFGQESGGFVKGEGGRGGGGGGFGSQGMGAGAGGKSGDQGQKSTRNLVVMNLEQIRRLTSPGSGCVIHRQKANMISTVGKVMSVSEQSTKCVYVITDYTDASIEVQLWRPSEGPEGDGSRRAIPSVMEETYIRVYGQPRFQASLPPHIVAFKVVPILDLNEVTTHCLEVLFCSMVMEKHKKAVESGKVAPVISRPGPQANTQARVAPGINEGHSLVLRTITASTSPGGIGLNEIFDSIRTLTRDQIKKAVDFLANEGHVYTTVDDEHFKATDV